MESGNNGTVRFFNKISTQQHKHSNTKTNDRNPEMQQHSSSTQ
jgi:hypothetical protein